MTALEVTAVVGDAAVRVGLVVLLAGLSVVLLLLLVRPAQDAVRYIAPGAGQAARDVAVAARRAVAAARAWHEAGRARVAAYDEAQARREALQLRRVA